jgi:hypothetical protein
MKKNECPLVGLSEITDHREYSGGIIDSVVFDTSRAYGLGPKMVRLLTLTAISAAIGKGVQLRVPPHTCRGNLFTLVSAPSGRGKSLVFKRIMDPLYQIQNSLNEVWEKERYPQIRADLKKLEIQEKRIERSKAPCREELRKLQCQRSELERSLIRPRILTEDVTSQMLAKMLSDFDGELASLSADAGASIAAITGAWSKSGHDEHVYLKSFSGDPLITDRISRETNICRDPCLTLGWSMTPDQLNVLVSNKRFREGGLLPRCLICSEEQRTSRSRPPSQMACKEVTEEWDRFLNWAFRLREKRLEIIASDSACSVFNAFQERIQSGENSIELQLTLVSRAREIAMRMSILIHLAKCFEYGGEVVLEIDAETAEEACQTCEGYLVANSKEMRQIVDTQIMEVSKRLEEIITTKGEPCIGGMAYPIRELRNRNGFTDEIITQLISRFPEKWGSLEKPPSPSGGRPSKCECHSFKDS